MGRHLADWIMKFVLLFFIVARFISGSPAETTAADQSTHSSNAEA